MREVLKEIDVKFVEIFNDCERFACLARDKFFQIESCEKLEGFKQEILNKKSIAIQKEDEESANRILYYQLITQTLISELKMWISFKDNQPDKAWEHLVNSQSNLTGALKAFDVSDLLEPYVEKLDQLEQLLFPKMLFASVGFKALKKTCSICNTNYDDCDHIKGRPYLGSLCYVTIEGCELEEVSIVDEPANKHCRMLTIEENGIVRDLMTWIQVEKNLNER